MPLGINGDSCCTKIVRRGEMWIYPNGRGGLFYLFDEGKIESELLARIESFRRFGLVISNDHHNFVT